jgi:arginyl-tRNA synthetase
MPDEKDENVINQIAMATIKFGDLVNNYTNDYVFDLDKFSQYEGKTGPYLLYTAVRAKSIIRKLFGDDYNLSDLCSKFKINHVTSEYEEKLQLQLIQFPVSVFRAYDNSQPHHMCDFAYSLANCFNKFYVNCHIANVEDENIKNTRIALCLATIKAMTISTDLLGISIPEKM